jgi:hypothetical protein
MEYGGCRFHLHRSPAKISKMISRDWLLGRSSPSRTQCNPFTETSPLDPTPMSVRGGFCRSSSRAACCRSLRWGGLLDALNLGPSAAAPVQTTNLGVGRSNRSGRAKRINVLAAPTLPSGNFRAAPGRSMGRVCAGAKKKPPPSDAPRRQRSCVRITPGAPAKSSTW